MRFWEIDAARGAAIAGMLLFNWSYALHWLRLIATDNNWLYWWLFPRLVAGTFIFIAGLSMMVSWQRMHSVRKFVIRGILLFSLGLLITAGTWLIAPQYTVVFGILHFMGAAAVMGIPFLRTRHKLLAAAAILLLGAAAEYMTVETPWLLWLGLAPAGFTTFDYFPVFPWLGVYLLGMHAGEALYVHGRRMFRIGPQPRMVWLLSAAGRYSLIIYLLHQPFLAAVLLALGLL